MSKASSRTIPSDSALRKSSGKQDPADLAASPVEHRPSKAAGSKAQRKAEAKSNLASEETDANPRGKAQEKSEKRGKLTKKELRSITLGDYAHLVLAKQYERLVQQEAGVLADQHPEHLHQMRVSSRRLRTALRVFESVVHLPKPAREKPIQNLARVLGQLRDLDVQIADLKEQYRPQVPKSEQQLIDQAIQRLMEQRVTALEQVQTTLTGAKYQTLKESYAAWLENPEYQPLADLPVVTALPDLLSPLLSELLLHPGWWVTNDQRHTKAGLLLHELRKTCKHARYQAEFFTSFYGDAFEQWVDELKQLQEQLGIVQDTHVLLEILASHGGLAELASLQQAIAQQQDKAMIQWDDMQAKYLEPRFRQSLYHMVLSPK
jgi:CHAD domain-containing protein